jgi:thiol-disulfide isomerase/thioredoxin
VVKVEIFSKKDCHLCDEAKAVLLRVQARTPFELVELDIEKDPALFERFKEEVPVVFVDGHKAFKYRVDEKDFADRILRPSASARQPAEPASSGLGRARDFAGVGHSTKVVFLIVAALSVAGVFANKWYQKLVVEPRQALLSLEIEPKHFPAPAFTLQDEAGHARSLADYRGKVVLLNFWATWCPPCRAEIPSMTQLAEELGNEPNFALVALSVDDNWATVKGFFRGQAPGFQLLLDKGGHVSEAYGTTMYPESYVIDPSGKVIAKFTGPRDWTDPAAESYFRSLVD